MEHDKIICLDIETVPDRTLIPEWERGKVPAQPIWHRIEIDDVRAYFLTSTMVQSSIVPEPSAATEVVTSAPGE
ncbi:hypothetical protein V1273_003660 [Bradyrhizobium sp. AZCC 1721]